MIRGYTIHRALGFRSGDLTKAQLAGSKPVPELIPTKRESLLRNFRNAKVLFIDEVYAVTAVLFDIINRRLQDIFRSPKPFGGLVVVLVGDPRQIVPVNGRALFNIQKYLSFPDDSHDTHTKSNNAGWLTE